VSRSGRPTLAELCERARSDELPTTGGEPPHLSVLIDWEALRTGLGTASLVARDRGCAFPGCHRPPSLCAAHHVRHWADGGPTSVGNCCLLCASHHQQVHLQGWDIGIHGGRVEFQPPPILDPDRRPLTNPLRR
jgi:hypothetical protein